MTAILLNEKEEALRREIDNLLKWLHAHLEHSSGDEYKEFIDKMAEMAQKAHMLHMSLKERGYEPKHHRYMLRNRGVPPTTVQFYDHIHPVEDLLIFVEYPNVVREDSTIGQEFNFKIYSRRWGHFDNRSLTRTERGWIISSGIIVQSVECKKNGKPGLLKFLEHDSIAYPHNVGMFLEWIWEKAAEGCDKETVQEALNDLAEWISACERSVPSSEIWEGLT